MEYANAMKWFHFDQMDYMPWWKELLIAICAISLVLAFGIPIYLILKRNRDESKDNQNQADGNMALVSWHLEEEIRKEAARMKRELRRKRKEKRKMKNMFGTLQPNEVAEKAGQAKDKAKDPPGPPPPPKTTPNAAAGGDTPEHIDVDQTQM